MQTIFTNSLNHNFPTTRPSMNKVTNISCTSHTHPPTRPSMNKVTNISYTSHTYPPTRPSMNKVTNISSTSHTYPPTRPSMNEVTNISSTSHTYPPTRPSMNKVTNISCTSHTYPPTLYLTLSAYECIYIVYTCIRILFQEWNRFGAICRDYAQKADCEVTRLYNFMSQTSASKPYAANTWSTQRNKLAF